MNPIFHSRKLGGFSITKQRYDMFKRAVHKASLHGRTNTLANFLHTGQINYIKIDPWARRITITNGNDTETVFSYKDLGLDKVARVKHAAE